MDWLLMFGMSKYDTVMTGGTETWKDQESLGGQAKTKRLYTRAYALLVNVIKQPMLPALKTFLQVKIQQCLVWFNWPMSMPAPRSMYTEAMTWGPETWICWQGVSRQAETIKGCNTAYPNIPPTQYVTDPMLIMEHPGGLSSKWICGASMRIYLKKKFVHPCGLLPKRIIVQMMVHPRGLMSKWICGASIGIFPKMKFVHPGGNLPKRIIVWITKWETWCKLNMIPTTVH